MFVRINIFISLNKNYKVIKNLRCRLELICYIFVALLNIIYKMCLSLKFWQVFLHDAKRAHKAHRYSSRLSIFFQDFYSSPSIQTDKSIRIFLSRIKNLKNIDGNSTIIFGA